MKSVGKEPSTKHESRKKWLRRTHPELIFEQRSINWPMQTDLWTSAERGHSMGQDVEFQNNSSCQCHGHLHFAHR
jgi:hypothetical protein